MGEYFVLLLVGHARNEVCGIVGIHVVNETPSNGFCREGFEEMRPFFFIYFCQDITCFFIVQEQEYELRLFIVQFLEDFSDICEKNNFAVNDFREQWIDFPEFLSYLPTLRSQSYDSVLASTAVQEMRDSYSHYYFRIDAVRREGETIPLERLSATIRRILFNQRKGEIIRNHEEELYRQATEKGDVKLFDDTHTRHEKNDDNSIR